jgi:hypothetical protein
MRSGSTVISAVFLIGILLQTSQCRLFAQQADVAMAADNAAIPEGPRPQFDAGAPFSERQTAVPDDRTQQPAANTPPAQDSSSSQAAPASPDEQKGQHEKAEQQIKQQEKQRVLGILPAFNTSYQNDAVSLTAKQKIGLAFRSATDPVTFATALIVAGYGEVADSDSGFPWGAKGYGERAGAKYLDAFDGGMIGNGFLPAILHQDPRYFRRGHGSTGRRLLYAASTSFICKHDKTGKWEPNYSNVLGNIASGAISNLYYPSNDSGYGQAIGNGFTVTAEGALGAVFQEFWPDISRKFLHRDPTNGLDAEARAADKAEKEARKKRE